MLEHKKQRVGGRVHAGTRYRSCQKPQEKVRWHALYLVSQGAVAADAARRVGRASSWITSLARRYNQEGAASVARRKSTKLSHRAKVSQQLGKELDKALRAPTPDGGLWTAPKVAAWIAEQSGHEVHQTTAWRALRRLGFSLQVPRPPTSGARPLKSKPSSKKDRA